MVSILQHPSSDWIMVVWVISMLKLSTNVKMYDETTDPQEYTNAFITKILFYRVLGNQMCQAFPLTLKKPSCGSRPYPQGRSTTRIAWQIAFCYISPQIRSNRGPLTASHSFNKVEMRSSEIILTDSIKQPCSSKTSIQRWPSTS